MHLYSFDENGSLVAYVKIDSNVLNMDANVSYKETLQVKTVTIFPKSLFYVLTVKSLSGIV